MIPLTGARQRAAADTAELEEVAKQVVSEKGPRIADKFGTMIEIPRAAVTAGGIATLAEFFRFGTNDLTQMTYGFSAVTTRSATSCSSMSTTGFADQPVPDHRPRRRGPADGDCVQEGRRTRPTWKWASVASMVVTRIRSNGATSSASTTSPVRPSACRLPGWRRLRPPSPRRKPTRLRKPRQPGKPEAQFYGSQRPLRSSAPRTRKGRETESSRPLYS